MNSQNKITMQDLTRQCITCGMQTCAVANGNAESSSDIVTIIIAP